MELMEDNVYAPPKADLTRKHHDGEVTTLMIDHLQTAAKWARVLSVIGYIVMIMMIIGGLVVLFFASLGRIPMGDPVEAAVSVVVLVICLFIIFKISRFLQKYAYFNRQLSDSYDVLDLIEGQEYFRRYVKWLGINFGIYVVIGGIAFVFLIGLGMIRG